MRVEKNHIFFDDLLNAKIAVKKASKKFETCKHEDYLVCLFFISKNITKWSHMAEAKISRGVKQ